MPKFKSRFNGNTTQTDAYWVPELNMWVVPSETKYIAYLWSDSEFKANFEEIEE